MSLFLGKSAPSAHPLSRRQGVLSWQMMAPSFHGAPRQTTPGQAGRTAGTLRGFGVVSEL